MAPTHDRTKPFLRLSRSSEAVLRLRSDFRLKQKCRNTVLCNKRQKVEIILRQFRQENDGACCTAADAHTICGTAPDPLPGSFLRKWPDEWFVGTAVSIRVNYQVHLDQKATHGSINAHAHWSTADDKKSSNGTGALDYRS